jgi:2-polyprenyl-3-methyl-5-hydroxy-6-metoxy-1,4-benzoquinol methylase
MPLTRQECEQAFHDRQAQQRAVDLAARGYRFDEDEYLDHAPWIRPALARLGDVGGKHVLDLGCGHGMAGVILARRGASVTALDLSLGYVREAHQRAQANGVRIQFVQAAGERLPFADETFDRIWGSAILHHLEPRRAAGELRRVLRPGGMAVFCEPWGENPLLRWARAQLRYPEKGRTPDETPLRASDIAVFKEHFGVTVQGQQLLGMLSRLRGPAHRQRMLERWDNALLGRWPSLTRWCRYVVVELLKTT